MSLSDLPAPSLLHPLDTMARTRQALTAEMIKSVMFSGFSMTMLPKPMYMGLGPARRNASNSRSGVYGFSSRKKKPQTSMYDGQSEGFGTNAGDQQYVKGTWSISARRGATIFATASSPKVFFLQRLITSPSPCQVMTSTILYDMKFAVCGSLSSVCMFASG